MQTDDIKEMEAMANLGVLLLFVQRSPYTGITYQPKVNHCHLDIGNYTTEYKEHRVN